MMLTRARRGNIIIGSKSILNSDPLWQQWLLWASARGAISGEPAKGTWQPRYLVDDRDGMWTVKAALIDPKTAPAVQAVEAKEVKPEETRPAKPAKLEVPEEIVDDWEDMITPTSSPVKKAGAIPESPPGTPGAEFRLDAPEDPTPALDAAEAAPAPVAAQARTHADRSAAQVCSDMGLESGDYTEERRVIGSPTVCPTSPARQMALANMGLLDECDG